MTEETYEFEKEPFFAYSTAWKPQEKAAARFTNKAITDNQPIKHAPVRTTPLMPPIQKAKSMGYSPQGEKSPFEGGKGDVKPTSNSPQGENSPFEGGKGDVKGGKGDVKPTGIIHIQATHHIYVTKNYNLFEKLPGNRSLNKTKIKKIITEIKAGTNLLKECPIIVAQLGAVLFVIDGQHRLEICRQLDSYVWYIIRENISLFEIAKMNTNTEKWTTADYINCYTATSNRHYEKLKAFIERTKFPAAVCVELLTKGLGMLGNSSHLMDQFRAGQFEVLKETEAHNISECVLKFSDFKNHSAREFVAAICEVLKSNKVPFQDLVNSYNAAKELLVYNANKKGYLSCLETIINKNKKQRITLY